MCSLQRDRCATLQLLLWLSPCTMLCGKWTTLQIEMHAVFHKPANKDFQLKPYAAVQGDHNPFCCARSGTVTQLIHGVTHPGGTCLSPQVLSTCKQSSARTITTCARHGSIVVPNGNAGLSDSTTTTHGLHVRQLIILMNASIYA